MNYIDISTENKKKEVLELFKSFNKIGDIYEYFGKTDNSSNVKYIKKIAEEIGFDLKSYKEKEKKFCLNCGKELEGRWQKKFCCNSCATSYNNRIFEKSEETKEKISKSLKDYYLEHPKVKKVCIKKNIINKNILICKNCGKRIINKNSNFFCCEECSNEFRHKEAYNDFLENNENYCRGNYTPKNFKNEFLREQGGICAICGCLPEHNGKPLVFVLDHINGDASDNRRENLRMICPNCDSQLDTFKSKNKNSTRRNYWKENLINKIKKEYNID